MLMMMVEVLRDKDEKGEEDDDEDADAMGNVQETPLCQEHEHHIGLLATRSRHYLP